MPEAILAQLKPEAVSPAIVYLASENAPTRAIVCAGAGSFERAYITITPGIFIGHSKDAADHVAAKFDAISDRKGDSVPGSALDQGKIEIANAMAKAS
jgi:hypothetical protein